MSLAKTVIIPADNEPDIEDFDDEVKSSLNFIPVRHISEVLAIALV